MQDTGTQGEAYPEGKTVYGDKETLLVNKKKHLPKQYIAIAAVVAAAAIGGGVMLSPPEARARPGLLGERSGQDPDLRGQGQGRHAEDQ